MNELNRCDDTILNILVYRYWYRIGGATENLKHRPLSQNKVNWPTSIIHLKFLWRYNIHQADASFRKSPKQYSIDWINTIQCVWLDGCISICEVASVKYANISNSSPQYTVHDIHITHVSMKRNIWRRKRDQNLLLHNK